MQQNIEKCGVTKTATNKQESKIASKKNED